MSDAASIAFRIDAHVADMTLEEALAELPQAMGTIRIPVTIHLPLTAELRAAIGLDEN